MEEALVQHYADASLAASPPGCCPGPEGDLPASRRIRFKMHLMVVVLPAPFSPIRPMMVPRGGSGDVPGQIPVGLAQPPYLNAFVINPHLDTKC